MDNMSLILAAAIVLIVIVTLMSTVKIVPQGYEYTVERLGRYTRSMSPGLHILTPFIERVGRRMSMMETVLDIPTQEVITKDNAMVGVDGIVFFQVLVSSKAAYEVANLELAILNLTMTNIRTVMGSMDLDQLLSQRDEINARLLGVVDQATDSWGVKVTRIEIKDINPPRDIVNAMARQMKAEREKRAAILEAEGERQSEILRAEGDKQAAILEAEGRQEAAFRDAEARERAAEAEANATRSVNEAIASGDARAINYFVAQKYVAAMEAFAKSPNAKTIFMPMEATGLIGSLGGMVELLNKGEGSDRHGSNGAATSPTVPNSGHP